MSVKSESKYNYFENVPYPQNGIHFVSPWVVDMMWGFVYESVIPVKYMDNDSEGYFNIKINMILRAAHHYRNSHYDNKMVSWLSYLW